MPRPQINPVVLLNISDFNNQWNKEVLDMSRREREKSWNKEVVRLRKTEEFYQEMIRTGTKEQQQCYSMLYDFLRNSKDYKKFVLQDHLK